MELGDHAAAAVATLNLYGSEILTLLRGIHRTRDDAEEAFSRFLERLWTTLPGWRAQCSMRTWAYLLARHASLDLQRAGKKARRSVPLTDARVSAVAEKIRTQTSPFRKTSNRSAIAQLREELDEPDRMLLVLRVDRALAWNDLALVFLGEGASPAERTRESARLRKRFQLVKDRLRELARDRGILGEPE